jgi:hypothetical protein
LLPWVALAPVPAAAQEAPAAPAKTPKKKRVRRKKRPPKPPPAEPAAPTPPAEDATAQTPEAAPPAPPLPDPAQTLAAPVPPPEPAPAAQGPFLERFFSEKPSRYAFLVGGAFTLAGAGFGYWSRGEATRANSIAAASKASRTFEEARHSASTGNMLFALAAVSVAYGLVLEFLPTPAADAAQLTYHF